ncbi:hypothetical protein QBC36DRAFT_305905 [Triangularia setosa]|uniref:Uncharacterized protein n=1 Tax=Triangularia setosa TaxID=2587417 RepID=A0AAN6WH88_9PEZI|nr:hypothetical protein QBC36DRAFT_305905 [Podospora setosa]
MDSPNSTSRVRQRSAAASASLAVAAKIPSAGAPPSPALAATPFTPERRKSWFSDFPPLGALPITTTTAGGTTLKNWQQFPHPPLSHYDTTHHYSFWNPALPQPAEKHSSLSPELETAIANREKGTKWFTDEQGRINSEVMGVDSRIKGKQQALEQVRHNKLQLKFQRGKDTQTLKVEIEHYTVVEKEVLEELESLGKERKRLAARGKEMIEQWLRGEWRAYRGY